MPTKRTKFIFVNKTASSSTLTQSSEGRERSRILRHVRRNHLRLRARTATRDGNELAQSWMRYVSCFDEQGIQEDSGSDCGCEGVKQFDSTGYLRKTRDRACSSISISSPSSAGGYPARRSNHVIMSLPVSVFASDSAFPVQPWNNGYDPFLCTAVGTDAEGAMHLLAHPVSTHLSRLTFLAEALAPVEVVSGRNRSARDQAREARRRACVHDELLMYSSLAHVTCSMSWYRGTPCSPQSEYFTYRTLEAVRARLNNNCGNNESTHSLMISILTLAFVELWKGSPSVWQQKNPVLVRQHFDNCRLHLKALMALSERLRGLRYISAYVLGGMLLVDRNAAFFTSSEPILSSFWDPLPLEPFPGCAKQADQYLSVLGSAFPKHNLQADLQDILENIAKLCRLAEFVWTQSEEDVGALQENWLYRRCQSLHHQLLRFRPLGLIEKCVKAAALAFLLTTTAHASSQFRSRIAARKLLEIVAEAAFVHSRDDRRLLLWCLCTGLMVEQDVLVGHSILMQLISAFENPFGLLDENLESKLKAFLYLPQRQRASFERLSKRLDAFRR